MNLCHRSQGRGEDIRVGALGCHQHTSFPVGEFAGIEVGSANLCVEDRESQVLMAVFGLPCYLCFLGFSLFLVISPFGEVGRVEAFFLKRRHLQYLNRIEVAASGAFYFHVALCHFGCCCLVVNLVSVGCCSAHVVVVVAGIAHHGYDVAC